MQKESDKDPLFCDQDVSRNKDEEEKFFSPNPHAEPAKSAHHASPHSGKHSYASSKSLNLGNLFGMNQSNLKPSGLAARRKMSGLSVYSPNNRRELESFSTTVSTGKSSPLLSKYNRGAHLGSGCQGSVYRVERKRDGMQFVMKQLTANEEQNLNMARSEIKLLG